MADEQTPDLEVARDERVFPVAQGVLEDFASIDVGADENFKLIVEKLLQRGLDADLNLTTDNSYVFQLVLTGYSAFSTVVQKCKVAEAQDVRYANIGRELMKILADAKVPMGKDVKSDEQVLVLEALQPQMEAIFARENLTWMEVKYIMEGFFGALKAVEQLYNDNVDMSLRRMEAKILGIEDMADLTMKKLDEVLTTPKEPAPPVEEPPAPPETPAI